MSIDEMSIEKDKARNAYNGSIYENKKEGAIIIASS